MSEGLNGWHGFFGLITVILLGLGFIGTLGYFALRGMLRDEYKF
ncbi:MAG: hypothetical protein SFX74_04530 [Fimbriimonadaceae bacterium]|nr:hypothetical protein [Fimbriimonadaceae bacterium]